MKDHPASPALAVGAVSLSATGGRAAMLLDGATRVYDLVAGRRIAEHSVEGPSLALSPDGRWLAATDGAVRDAVSGQVAWRAPFSGMVRFLSDDRLMVVGVGQLLLVDWRTGWTQASIYDDRLDPSSSARVVRGPGSALALIDPAGDEPALIDLDAERLLPLDEGAAADAAFHGGALLAVQGGALCRWDPRDGALLGTTRPHGGQTLAVAAGAAGFVTAGVEVDGRYTLRSGMSAVSLPDRAPSSPALFWTDAGWLVDLWAGVVLAGPEGVRRSLTLPLKKDGARPFRAARPLSLAGERLLLACSPPFVYGLDLRFRSRLEPVDEDTEGADQPD